MAVQQVIHSFANAARLRDVEAMLSYCAPDMVVFDLVPPLRHEGMDAIRQVWTKTISAFEAPLDFDLKHLKTFVDGKLAFGRSVNRFGGKRLSGDSASSWTCMTLGLRKIGPDWKIIHQHVSVPFDMETGQALTDLEP